MPQVTKRIMFNWRGCSSLCLLVNGEMVNWQISCSIKSHNAGHIIHESWWEQCKYWCTLWLIETAVFTLVAVDSREWKWKWERIFFCPYIRELQRTRAQVAKRKGQANISAGGICTAQSGQVDKEFTRVDNKSRNVASVEVKVCFFATLQLLWPGQGQKCERRGRRKS